MPLPGFNKHGSARMERGKILICIFSIFIFVQDVPYYNHAAGSQASMILGKILALISLRGVVSSPRLHGVVIDTTLLATGSSYGKIPALTSRGVVISSQMNGAFLPASPSSSTSESGAIAIARAKSESQSKRQSQHIMVVKYWASEQGEHSTPHCAKLSVVTYLASEQGEQWTPHCAYIWASEQGEQLTYMYN